MASFSLPLACTLPANHSRVSKSHLSTTTTTTTPKLTTNNSFPFKKSPLSSKPFIFRTAALTADNDALTSAVEAEPTSTQTLISEDQWKAERETLLQQIQNLELQIQQLATTNTAATADGNSNNNVTKTLETILKDIHSVGLKILALEPKNSVPIQTASVSEALANIAKQLQATETSSSSSGPSSVSPINPNPNTGHPSVEEINQMVRDMVKLYYPEGIVTSPFLQGNFGPIREETPPTADLVITGQLPQELEGMMLRIGPNPQYDPEADYKWLDGDGMIHGVRIKDGRATYVARYVRTSRFIQESAFGKATMFKFGDLTGAYGLFVAFVQLLRAKLEILDMSYDYANMNTNLVYHQGVIMALEDFGKPHVISVKDNGDLETVGINEYNGKLDHALSPHPKKDPNTGEMFTFGSMFTSPYLIYRVVNSDGSMRDSVPITVPGPSYMHDLVLTQKYVVFMDLSFIYSPEAMLKNNDWIFNFDPAKKCRFGVLPRYATSEAEIKWFEFEDPFLIFHNANAWEEGEDEVVVIGGSIESALDTRTNMPYINPIIFSKGTKDEEEPLSLAQLYKFTLNMRTGEATKEKLSDSYIEYPRINDYYTGRKTNIVYAGEMDKDAKIYNMIKYYLQDQGPAVEVKKSFGSGKYVSGEHVFVSRTIFDGEDDGYLITFVHDENTDESYFYVLDAKSPEMKVVATIKLPNRVPYGFHSIFVSENELQAQLYK